MVSPWSLQSVCDGIWGLFFSSPVLTSPECRTSIPGTVHLKIRLWHPAKICNALSDFSCQSLVYAQDFYLLSLIPPKRKAQLFSTLDFLGEVRALAGRGAASADLQLSWEKLQDGENGGAAPHPPSKP